MPPSRAWYGSTFALCFVVGLVLARFLLLDAVELATFDAMKDAILHRQPVTWSGIARSSMLQKLMMAAVACGTLGVLAQLLYRKVRGA